MPVDPAFAELLADKRSELRALPETVPMEAVRAGNKSYLVTAPRTPIHAVEDRSFRGPAGDVALRFYRPDAGRPRPFIVFFHGGGFVMGDLDTHDTICHRLAHSSGCVVVAVDYRRAPETRFPGALDDCSAALRWLVANATELGLDPARVALCGDSAGGNLATAVALRARDDGQRLMYLALLYPMIDPACDSASMHEFARGYLLARGGVQWAWALYLGPDGDASHPHAAPLRAELKGMPPTTVATAEFDPLRDEGEAFAGQLREAGATVVTRRYAGMVHGFAGLPQLTPVAFTAIDDIAADIRAAI